MQLLVLILSQTEKMPSIVSALVNGGFGNPTVVDCQGSLRILDDSDVEPPPIFGSLRYMLHGGTHDSKMMFSVLPDEKIDGAKSIINEKVGGIDKPDTGIIFTVPISSVEGLRK